MKQFFFILFLFLLSLSGFSQDKYIIVPIAIVDGDTMPYISLREVAIQAKLTRKLKRTISQNEKLLRNVRITMPLAIACRMRLKTIDEEMAKLPTKIEQKSYYEKAEAKLKADFEGQNRFFRTRFDQSVRTGHKFPKRLQGSHYFSEKL